MGTSTRARAAAGAYKSYTPGLRRYAYVCRLFHLVLGNPFRPPDRTVSYGAKRISRGCLTELSQMLVLITSQ